MLNKLQGIGFAFIDPASGWEDIGFTERVIWVNAAGYGWVACDEPNTFYGKLDSIEHVPIQSLVNAYIAKLNKEINELKKENMKLDNFKTVIKALKVPKAESIQREFASIVDPSIDMRQRLTRIESLSRKSKAQYLRK